MAADRMVAISGRADVSTTCAACGAALVPGAKRCAACGAPPVPPAAIARRASPRPVLDAVAELTPQSVAPVPLRVLAFTIDVVVLVLAAGVGYLVASVSGGLQYDDGSWAPMSLAVPGLLVVAALTQWLVEAGTGATVGNGTTGIRTMGSGTHRPAGMLAIGVRALVELAGAVLALVGAWVVASSGAWDRSPARRGWHDKAARTLVLRARSVRDAGVDGPGTAPAVARALRAAEPAPGLVRPAPGVVAAPRPAPLSVGPIIEAAPGLVRPAPAPGTAAETAVVPPELITGPPGPRVVHPEVRPDVPLIDVPNRLLSELSEPGAPGPVIGAPPTEAISVVRPRRRVPRLPRIGGRSKVRPDGLVEPEIRPADPGLPELEHARLRPEEPPARVTPPGLVLLFDTGERVVVEGDGLVGRAPDAEPGLTHLVAVDDPDSSISRVHLAFGQERRGNRLWFVDRGSTNGTVLVRPDGTELALAPGKRARVEAGWIVRFGRRSIEVRSTSEHD